jgi:putative ABC transport system permease protein
VAGLVLLLACANVANLLLSRGVSRRGEVAVRRALGGSRGRLIRAQLLEGLLIAAAAGVVGLVLAFWLASLFQGMTLPGGNPWVYNGIGEPTLDWRVLSFVVVVTLAAGLAAGILPGWVSARANLVESLKASGATGLVGPRRLRGSLVAVQLGVSVALLVTALLLARTVRNLAQIPVGFDADRVTAFAISPPYSGYGREQAQMILRRVVAQVRTVPGVEDAALSASTPFSSTIGGAVQQNGATASDPSAPVVSAWVGPDYFRTIGIHLLSGRGFSDDEEFLPIARASEGVAVISVSQAKALFGTTDAVGRVVQNKDGFGSSCRIIGVVPDTRWAGLLPGSDEAPFYQPLPSFAEGGTMLVRSRLPVAALRPAVERAVAAVAPSVPLFDVERLSDKIHRSVAEQRLLAKILSAFTLLAVALAGAGLYAVVAFSVAERTREVGIRIALGARAGQVVGLVVRRGMTLGAVGLVLGIAGAMGLGRIVASQFYGVAPLDAASYLIATTILFALVLVASALPARRATQVEPIDVLRHE